MAKVSLVTPTSDRPRAFGLLVDYVSRLSLTDLDGEWIVVDDGVEPVRDCRQIRERLFTNDHLPNGLRRRYFRREPSVTPLESFAANLLKGLGKAEGEWIFILEDDDWYHRYYLEWMARFLGEYELVGLGGEGIYYHVGVRRWRTIPHEHATSLSRTAFTRAILGDVFRAVDETASRGQHAFDYEIWTHSARFLRFLSDDHPHVVSMKGLPGKRGMGGMHDASKYVFEDWNMRRLQGWIGRDASNYDGFLKKR